MTRDRLIEETLEMARKYNDFIVANNLHFTPMNIRTLEYQLEKRTKSQVGTKSKEVLDMFNYLRSYANV